MMKVRAKEPEGIYHRKRRDESRKRQKRRFK